MKKIYTNNEDMAIQQLTGMHYSEGVQVQAVCRGMGLNPEEWTNIREDCSWLNDFEKKEIEEYLKEEFDLPAWDYNPLPELGRDN